jgi:hypothetical protein
MALPNNSLMAKHRVGIYPDSSENINLMLLSIKPLWKRSLQKVTQEPN